MTHTCLIVIPVEFYKTSDGLAWCESAFALHLKELIDKVYDPGTKLHIVCPSMSELKFMDSKPSMLSLDENVDGIKVSLRHPSHAGRLIYNIRWLIPNVFVLRALIKQENVAVHSGPSSNPLMLFEFVSIIFAVLYKRPSLFVVDIDERDSAHMDFVNGALSKKSYYLRKYFYDPFFSYQIKYAVKNCNLVMLKGRELKLDYGPDQQNVKDFLDVAFTQDDLISHTELTRKTKAFVSGTLRLIYFGRLVRYKGVLDMIDSVVESRKRFNSCIELTIVGDGDDKPAISNAIERNGAGEFIFLKEAVAYGPGLFDLIDKHDALLAAPQRQDTPRSIFDAMARGLGTIAYDTYYYKDLAISNAVLLSPWKDISKLAQTIHKFAIDLDARRRVANSAFYFAKSNTQDVWLEKRKNWVKEFLGSS